MAQVRIRHKQPATSARATAVTTAAIAAVLVAGGMSTLAWDQVHETAAEAVASLIVAGQGATTSLDRAWMGLQPVDFRGRQWVPADHPAVAFDAAEVVAVGTSGTRTIFANRLRGLPALSANPRPYDRIYVKPAGEAYVPLRWRHVP